MYGQPHERLCSLPVSVIVEKPAKRTETGVEPGSRDPECNALDRSATVATRVRNFDGVNTMHSLRLHVHYTLENPNFLASSVLT